MQKPESPKKAKYALEERRQYHRAARDLEGEARRRYLGLCTWDQDPRHEYDPELVPVPGR